MIKASFEWILHVSSESDDDEEKERINKVEASKKKVDKSTRELLKISSDLVTTIKNKNTDKNS